MPSNKRRYKQDPKTGKMDGSVPLVVNPPETDNPWRDSPPFQKEEGVLSDGYDTLFDMYSKKRTIPDQFEPEAYPERFLGSHHPLAKEVNDAFVGLDNEQKCLAIGDYLSSLEYRIRKMPGVYLQGQASDEEWQWWCHQQADRVSGDNPALASDYRDLAEQMPPTNYEFAYLISARGHAKGVSRSYDREMRYLAGYHGKNPDDIRIAVESQRLAFLRMKPEERPTVPGWFKEGIDSSYWGKEKATRPPQDDATTWGLYSVLTNPDVTDSLPVAESQEYVVFDTETTGLSDSAAIVQLTAIRYDSDGNEQERISTYLKPNDLSVFESEDAKYAREVTGITAETVKDAPRFSDIAPQLRSMMTGRTLVAHNLMFDYPRVQRAFAESADESGSPGERALPLSPIVDTLRLARWVQPNPGVPRKEWKHTLEHACKRADIAFNSEEAHDALYDVERTNDLFRYLKASPLGGTKNT